MKNPLREIFHSLIQKPSPKGRGDARHSRLLASLLVFIIPVSLVITIFPGMIYYGNTLEVILFLVVLISSFLLVLGYLLSSSITQQHVVLAVIGISTFIIFSAAIVDINLLPFLVVPLLLCAIFLSARATILIILLNLVGILLIPLYVMGESLSGKVFWGFNFTLIISVLLLIVIRHRNKLELSQRLLVREGKKQYRSILASTKDAILTLRETGEIVTWNKQAEYMFGYSKAEVRGEYITRLIPILRKLATEEGKEIDLGKEVFLNRVDSYAKSNGLEGRRKDESTFFVEATFAS